MGKKGEPKGLQIADLLAMATRATMSVPICMRGDIAPRIDVLRDEWKAAIKYDAEHNEDDTAPGLWQQIADLEAEADAATVMFEVGALPSPEWRRLMFDHPDPEDELRFDPEGFPVVAVAACSVNPKMDEDEAQALAESLSNHQWCKLWGAVWTVNEGDDLRPKYASSTGPAPTSDQSLTTAAPEESLTASS